MSKIQSLSSVPGKETIYIDVEDEITTIIDKVQGSHSKIVALVLPKRASVLQSIVNMKLLKRTADNAGKNLVLVTSEIGLLPLAGATGMYVATTPSSKPAIPDAPASPNDEPEDVDEPLSIIDGTGGSESVEDFDSTTAAATPVGELAAAGVAGTVADDAIDESIDMYDDTPDTAATPVAAKAVAKPKKDKKLAVPNFDSFRKKIALGLLALIALVALAVVALVILPKATITIDTDSSTIATNLNLTLNTASKSLDASTGTVPAVSESQQKTSSQTVAATGQQNNGQKASGQIKITNCSGASITIQAGTSFSNSSHTFTAQDSVVVPDSNYSKTGSCHDDGTNTVNVTALRGGADYNLAAGSYTISGSPDNVSAEGSQMSGGTDSITKIVAQTDIDSATSKIASSDTTSVKQQLISGLESKGLEAVQVTLLAGTPAVTTSAKVGDAADNVTVTSVTTYTMLGVKKSDLQTLVKNNVEKQLDKGKQVILDDGVANAKFSASQAATTTTASISLSAKSVAGPQLDTTSLKTNLAGKKSGDVKSYIKQTPGVTDVTVHLSPFWVSSVPKKASKITITIVKASN